MRHLIRYKHKTGTIMRMVTGGKELAQAAKEHKLTHIWKKVKGQWKPAKIQRKMGIPVEFLENDNEE